MKELSIFVDESGDFGEYDYHSPYYILSFVFHEQERDISKELKVLNSKMSELELSNHTIHVGPIIRQEEEYRNMTFDKRKRILRNLMTFFRKTDIQYKTFHVEKKHIKDDIELVGILSKELSRFINYHLEYFLSFDVVKVYYDNGQIPVTRILSTALSILLSNVEFRKAMPSDYRLFQVADMLCSIELIKLKLQHSKLSNSEIAFFEEPQVFKKKYLKTIEQKLMK